MANQTYYIIPDYDIAIIDKNRTYNIKTKVSDKIVLIDGVNLKVYFPHRPLFFYLLGVNNAVYFGDDPEPFGSILNEI